MQLAGANVVYKELELRKRTPYAKCCSSSLSRRNLPLRQWWLSVFPGWQLTAITSTSPHGRIPPPFQLSLLHNKYNAPFMKTTLLHHLPSCHHSKRTSPSAFQLEQRALSAAVKVNGSQRCVRNIPRMHSPTCIARPKSQLAHSPGSRKTESDPA